MKVAPTLGIDARENTSVLAMLKEGSLDVGNRRPREYLVVCDVKER